MAEVGTVIAVLQLADRVVGLCKYWIEAVKDAPSDLRSILLETSMLQTIFSSIEFLISCDDTSSTVLSSLSQDDGPIDHCHQILMALVSLIPAEGAYTDDSSRSTREKMATMAARLAWPFRQSKARKLLEELGRYKSAITLALTTDSIQDIKDIKTKTTQIFDILSEHQRSEFYRWLQHTDPSPIHNRVRKQVEEGTCSWMLRLPEWADWLAAKYRCFWIHGIPGAGKTVLASYLVEEAERHCREARGPTFTTLYYYCYFGHNQDEAAPFLRWLITQLCRQSETICAYTYSLFKQGREPSLPELLNALAATLSPFETVYIILDAADESTPRDDLLKIIRDLVNDPRFCVIQLLVTSREYLDIERTLGAISRPVSMSNPFITNDIHCYIQSALQKNPKFKRWPQYLLDEALMTLSSRAKGMFRWAVCQIDRLQRLPCDVRVVRNTLATLPKTLEETYERIFLEISDEERFFVRQCMAWINFHSELYSHSIPCAVLLQALQLGDEGVSEPNDGHFFDEESLREFCGCLITVSLGSSFEVDDYDDEVGEVLVVSFAHYTVREFLESDRISTGAAAYFKLGEQVKLDMLSTVLLTAVSFGTYESSGLDGGSDFDIPAIPSRSHRPSHSHRQRNAYKDLTGDFRSYCVVTAIFSIAVNPDKIVSQQDLSRMTFRFLDPSNASNQPIMRFLNHCQDAFRLRSENDNLLTGFEFWNLVWTAEPNSTTTKTMLLFSILLLVERFEGLAGELLHQSEDKLIWVHEPLQFQLELGDGLVNLNGPMIEFFAQKDRLGSPRLRFLLDHGLTLPNRTALLHAYVGVHRENEDDGECEGASCLLRRMIDLGADPNDNSYTTTPLQIAVAAWDYIGVETLLEAGADPNRIGDLNGTRWRGIRENYKRLEGLSALFICQNISRKGRPKPSEAEKQMLEALLVQFGAKSFTTKQVLSS